MTTRPVELLKKELTPQLQGYLAKTSGETPAATAKAVDTAISALFSGIAAAAATPTGLTTVVRLVNDPVNDGTLLNQLPALYQGTMTASPIYRLGSQMLHQVFGAKLGTINQSIATLAGVKPSAAAMMTTTIAPHVLATLGAEQRATGNASAAGLARMLGVQPLPDTVSRAVVGAGSVAAAMTAATTATAGSKSPTEPHDDDIGKGAVAANTAGASRPATASAPTVGRAAAASAPKAKRRAAGSGAWLIFPAGLAIGAGLFGVGSLITDQVRIWPNGGEVRRSAVIATAPAAAPTLAAPVVTAATVATPAPVVAPAPAPKVVATAPAVPVPTPAPAAKPPAGASVAVAPVRVAEPETKPELKPGPPGTTSFFGASPSLDSKPATMNPDYTAVVSAPPATVVAAAAAPAIVVPEAAPLPSPPGTTTFFGASPSNDDKPAILNPDYTPIAPAPPPVVAAAAPPPAIVVPESTPRSSPPGTTMFFGSASRPADKPVVVNPDYAPAPSPPAVAVAPPPVPPLPVPQPTAAPPTPVATTPTARAPGTTNFFGTGAGAPPLPPVFVNPEYTLSGPKTPAVAAIAVPTLDLAGCRLAVMAVAGEVRFETASAAVARTSAAMLDRVATAFKSCAAGRLKVDGHTDDRGSAEYNLTLSEARARSVVAQLAKRGVDKSRLASEGFGFTKPLVPNSSTENMAKNRRIDFLVE